MILLFSTAATLYEGSEILSRPLEWKYSTPFTQLLHGGINNPSDISQLDYFVYAFKFQPIFPIIMVLSGLYLFILIGYNILKYENKGFAYYLAFLSGGLFVFSYFTSNSSTPGGQTFFYIFLVCGVIIIAMALLSYFQMIKRIWLKIAVD